MCVWVCVYKYTYMTNTCPYAYLCKDFINSVDVFLCKMDPRASWDESAIYSSR